MRPHWVMGAVLVWIVGTLMCLVIEGSQFGATEAATMANLTGISAYSGGGGITLFNAMPGGFLNGLVKVLSWDYSFLTGPLVIVRWLLGIITIGVLVELISLAVGFFQSLVGRRT